jgi:hypothetical protein
LIKKLLNKSEQQIFNDLEKSHHKDRIKIFPQQYLNQVIDSSDLEISKKEKLTFKHGIFDFVITDLEMFPLFVIEFDGPDHDRKKNMIADIRKMSICDKAHIPILRISYKIYDEFSKDLLINFIIDRFYKWKEEEKKLKDEFSEKAEILHKKNLPMEEIIDYLSIEDPSIIFNYRYYFPKITEIMKILVFQYNIYPNYCDLFNNFISKFKRTKSYEDYPTNGNVNCSVTYIMDGKLRKGHELFPFNEVITSDIIGLKWMYRINSELIDIEPNHGIDESRAFFNGIPGTSIIDLGNMLAELNCMKKILIRAEYLKIKNMLFINNKEKDIDCWFE